MVDSLRDGQRYNHLISNKREWNNCFIKKRPKHIVQSARKCIEQAVNILVFNSPREKAIFIMKMKSYFDVRHLQNRATIHVQI